MPEWLKSVLFAGALLSGCAYLIHDSGETYNEPVKPGVKVCNLQNFIDCDETEWLTFPRYALKDSVRFEGQTYDFAEDFIKTFCLGNKIRKFVDGQYYCRIRDFEDIDKKQAFWHRMIMLQIIADEGKKQ